MISIKNYISDLLYLHDCVIVPEFGGFVANHRNVSINEELSLFHPPNKEVGFNRSLIYNDGLLAHFISKKESISFSDAVIKIRSFVKEVNLQLLSGIEVAFADIGTFKIDAAKNLIFSFNEHSSFLTDSFGLTSFRFSLLKQKYLPSKIEFSKDSEHSINKFSFRTRAAAAAIIACFLFFSTDLKMPNIYQAGISSNLFDLQENIVELPIENDEFVEVDIENFTTKPIVVEKIESNDDEIIPEFDNSSPKYHLIVGSFPNNSLASKFLVKHQSDGYPDAKIVDNGSGRIRVALFSFSDKNEAIAELEKLRQKPQFSDAWLLTH